MVADPRQDENLIVAQMHVLFAKLHNKVITTPEVFKQSPHYQTAGSSFDAARRVITWHYQWLVLHDFLDQLVDPEVYRDVDYAQDRTLFAGSPDLAVPVEFSLAAFRFGHSMVRDEYVYNETHPEAKLRDDLMKQTGEGGGAVPALAADWKIDWSNFFFLDDDTASNRIRKIDAKIANGLFGLPPDGTDLPVMTLTRGACAGLPSGQRISRHLGIDPLSPSQIDIPLNASLIARCRFDTETPLWYYLLREAAVRCKGKNLGPVGSRIVVDTLIAVLQHDRDSYLNVAPDWRPTLAGAEGAVNFTMSDLLRFIL